MTSPSPMEAVAGRLGPTGTYPSRLRTAQAKFVRIIQCVETYEEIVGRADVPS